MVDQPKFQRHGVLIGPRGGRGGMVLKNVPIKICPNWAKGGKLNWSLNLQVLFDGIPKTKYVSLLLIRGLTGYC